MCCAESVSTSANLAKVFMRPMKRYSSIISLSLLYINDTSGWVVGDWGTILHSVDKAKTWSLSHMGQFAPLFSVCFKMEKLEGKYGIC